MSWWRPLWRRSWPMRSIRISRLAACWPQAVCTRHSCNPDDVWESMKKDRENYFFIDVQVRGEYPSYARKFLEKEGYLSGNRCG